MKSLPRKACGPVTQKAKHFMLETEVSPEKSYAITVLALFMKGVILCVGQKSKVLQESTKQGDYWKSSSKEPWDNSLTGFCR